MGCCDGWPLTSGDSEQAQLEAVGAQVPQAAADTEMNRWYELIRDNAGEVTNGQYLGGDVTDGFRSTSGDIVWIGADWLIGTSVLGDDTYAGAAVPGLRNGGLVEAVDGDFGTQVHHGGGPTGDWMRAVEEGGQAVGTHWWPICGLNDGGTDRVFCWHVQSATPPHYGTLLDVHLVSINVFGLYNSHVDCELGGTDAWWVDGCWRDTDTGFTYITGEQFVPDYDADTAGDDSVPNYGRGDPAAHYTLKRIARVPNGQLTTVANWRYWDGTGWVVGAGDAVPMVDHHGQPIHGDAGIRKLGANSYLLAAHQLVDTHVTMYTSAAPQGPWQAIARVPAPTQGQVFGDGVQIGQLVKVLAFTPPAVPAGHSMVLVSRNLLNPDGPPISSAGHNIRRYAPQFVVVPNSP